LFNPSRFVKPEHLAEYRRWVGNFTQAQREDFLIGMMNTSGYPTRAIRCGPLSTRSRS
jgi:hypothetical protein